ncbi:YbaB/EbfC family nucleoid-associated protein [Saccharopolyspora shandongensis]|uniref:YbaB/EbfC family nucleoid-associated protein n=1 Tax=Saccharopolyspora shandongensis TaxID=418495 RepID=UPI00343A89E7
MSSPLFNEMEAAMAELRAQQAKIRDAQEQTQKETTSATSKDRMITVTVDHQQRLTAVRFDGTRYRSLAPAELANRIVELVREAQEDAAGKALAMFAQLAPTGFGSDIADVMGGDFDLDRMFDEAVRQASEMDDLLPDERKGSAGHG